MQTAREKFPTFPSLAPCMPRITSLYTTSCHCSGCRGCGVRLSIHACRPFEGLVVTSRSNAKNAFACAGRYFLRSCKIMFCHQCSLFLIAGHNPLLFNSYFYFLVSFLFLLHACMSHQVYNSNGGLAPKFHRAHQSQ